MDEDRPLGLRPLDIDPDFCCFSSSSLFLYFSFLLVARVPCTATGRFCFFQNFVLEKDDEMKQSFLSEKVLHFGTLHYITSHNNVNEIDLLSESQIFVL